VRETERRLRGAAIEIVVALAFAALAAAQTYPLVRRLGTHLPGTGLGDNAGFAWNLWWMRRALRSGQLDFFHTDHLMAPFGAWLIQHTHTALSGLLGATMLAGVPVVEAQNTLIVASIALNGLAAYGLTREGGAARAPAFLAGVLFLLAPPVSARLTGHFNFVAAWPLVLGCWACVRLIRRRSVLAALAFGAAAGATAWAEPYLFVFLGLASAVIWITAGWRFTLTEDPRGWGPVPLALAILGAVLFAAGFAIASTGGGQVRVWDLEISVTRPTNLLMAAWVAALAGLVVRMRPRIRAARRDRLPWRQLAVAAACAAIVLSPMLIAAWQLWTAGDYAAGARSLKSAPAGADLATLVMGPPFHGALGAHVRSVYQRFGIDPIESSAWLGVLPVALALWSALRFRVDPAVRQWTAVAAVCFVWALGPFLTILGHNLGLVLPQALAQLLPLVNNARIPGRALIVVSLALAVLAGLGLHRSGAGRPAIVAAIAVMGCLELLAAPIALAPVPHMGTAVRWLARQPAGTVLPIPFGVRDGFGERGRLDHGSLLLQFRHGQPLAGGFVARLPERVGDWYETTEPFGTLLRLSAGEGGADLPSCPDALAGLRAAGVR